MKLFQMQLIYLILKETKILIICTKELNLLKIQESFISPYPYVVYSTISTTYLSTPPSLHSLRMK
jgi:hypothetical protein